LQKNNTNIKTKDDLLAVLTDNGFIIDEKETKMKFFTDNEIFKIFIFSFSRKNNTRIKQFINEIFNNNENT